MIVFQVLLMFATAITMTFTALALEVHQEIMVV